MEIAEDCGTSESAGSVEQLLRVGDLSVQALASRQPPDLAMSLGRESPFVPGESRRRPVTRCIPSLPRCALARKCVGTQLEVGGGRRRPGSSCGAACLGQSLRHRSAHQSDRKQARERQRADTSNQGRGIQHDEHYRHHAEGSSLVRPVLLMTAGIEVRAWPLVPKSAPGPGC